MLYHVKVHDSSVPRGADGNTRSSLVAVSTGQHEDRLIVKTIMGPALHVRLLQSVLEQSIFEHSDYLLQCLSAHKARQFPYGVELRFGTHGAESLILRYRKDADLADVPNGGRVHVSMFGKLNEGIDLWYGDVPPLLEALYRRHVQAGTGDGNAVESVELPAPFDIQSHALAFRPAEEDDSEALVRALAPHLLPPPEESIPTPPAVEPDGEGPAVLTADALRAIGACEAGMQAFLTVFPDGVAPLTVESLRRWEEHGFQRATIGNFFDAGRAATHADEATALRAFIEGLRDRQRSYGER